MERGDLKAEIDRKNAEIAQVKKILADLIKSVWGPDVI